MGSLVVLYFIASLAHFTRNAEFASLLLFEAAMANLAVNTDAHRRAFGRAGVAGCLTR